MAQSTNPQVRIIVHTLDNGTKQARVVPPILVCGKGDTIEFINHTSMDAYLLFPDILDAAVAGEPPSHQRPIPPIGTTSPGKKHAPKIKAAQGAFRGTYTIFCMETNSMAVGNSAPEVIVEP